MERTLNGLELGGGHGEGSAADGGASGGDEPSDDGRSEGSDGTSSRSEERERSGGHVGAKERVRVVEREGEIDEGGGSDRFATFLAESLLRAPTYKTQTHITFLPSSSSDEDDQTSGLAR